MHVTDRVGGSSRPSVTGRVRGIGRLGLALTPALGFDRCHMSPAIGSTGREAS